MGKGNILIPLERLEEIENSFKDVEVTLWSDKWSEENGEYKQMVLVEGITEQSNPIIIPTEDEGLYASIIDVQVNNENIVFTTDELPERTFKLLVKSVAGENDSREETTLKDIAIPLFLNDWEYDEETSTYVQNVAIEILGGSLAPEVALSSVSEIASDDELYSYACISDVVVEEGNVKFIASELPKVSFTVVVKSVSAVGENVVAEVTSLVTRISELEEENAALNSNISEKDDLVHLGRITASVGSYIYATPTQSITNFKKILVTVTQPVSGILFLSKEFYVDTLNLESSNSYNAMDSLYHSANYTMYAVYFISDAKIGASFGSNSWSTTTAQVDFYGIK